MFSIYHFFAHLVRHKDELFSVSKLDEFPFDQGMLSCVNKGKIP
jgi:hypothetical protein